MENFARKAAKLLLFCGLFFLAIRYVHTYPLPMTPRQQHYLIVISEKFEMADYEMFYIVSMIAIDVVVTIVAYSIVVRLWRHYRTK
ncbi:hypothetical protein EVC45_01615 [Paraburkholderia sp. UYCP14C]|uniref:hypothetical protein n=1 Tax=Paraburkholderia sp. UYCP14C TaxID=2511130 RepID=UPI0010214A2F|nr:hypothetical protein [Paraburkholderia sp. UYCP14C]RZF31784.1 hypothetical protein EVC45_01615 [Paraburkholderia sp. UYCP14C]